MKHHCNYIEHSYTSLTLYQYSVSFFSACSKTQPCLNNWALSSWHWSSWARACILHSEKGVCLPSWGASDSNAAFTGPFFQCYHGEIWLLMLFEWSLLCFLPVHWVFSFSWCFTDLIGDDCHCSSWWLVVGCIVRTFREAILTQRPKGGKGVKEWSGPDNQRGVCSLLYVYCLVFVQRNRDEGSGSECLDYTSNSRYSLSRTQLKQA